MPETPSDHGTNDEPTTATHPDRSGQRGGQAPPNPYACYITDEEQAREQGARLQALFDAADSVEETDTGLRLTIPREGELAETAAAFAVLESWCCPWARYEVAFTRQREAIELAVTAPGDEEATALIQQYPAGEIPEGLETPDLPEDFEVEQPGVET